MSAWFCKASLAKPVAVEAGTPKKSTKIVRVPASLHQAECKSFRRS